MRNKNFVEKIAGYMPMALLSRLRCFIEQIHSVQCIFTEHSAYINKYIEYINIFFFLDFPAVGAFNAGTHQPKKLNESTFIFFFKSMVDLDGRGWRRGHGQRETGIYEILPIRSLVGRRWNDAEWNRIQRWIAGWLYSEVRACYDPLLLNYIHTSPDIIHLSKPLN